MKAKTALGLMAVIFSSFLMEANASNGAEAMESESIAKVRIVIQNDAVIVKLFDNPASRDFLSLLPLDVRFEDFASEEKITYLPRRLNTAGAPTPRDAEGDFTYYAPWGNLAVFYHGFGKDSRLYVLGKIESGKEMLSEIKGDFSARIEVAE